MKYFIVEGILKNSDSINENILKEHIEYSSQNAVDVGLILVSGIKGDESGGISIMKFESFEKVEEYLSKDPLKLAGIQEYRVIELTPHYIQSSASEWFKA